MISDKCETEEGGIVYIPMKYLHFLDILQDKNDDVAYAETKRIAAESELTDKYYKYIPELSEAILTELKRMDISCYKDNMIGLIQKDVNELKELIK